MDLAAVAAHHSLTYLSEEVIPDLSSSAVLCPNAPANANIAFITLEGAPIYINFDAETVTTTNGHRYEIGSDYLVPNKVKDAAGATPTQPSFARLTAIQSGGTASGFITYFLLRRVS